MANPPSPAEKPPESGSVVLSARAVAIELLEAVLKRRKPLDDALAEQPDLDKLVNRDRQFVRALVTCTLRHLGQIDHVLAQCLEKPLPARASAIRNILRLGTAQTLFLKTPAHAAVDTMVTLAGKRGGEAGYKGLVNAVLRRIAREADLFRQFAPGSGNFTGAISLPDWLWQSWVKAYGVAKATQIAIAHLEEPPLDFTVRRDPDHWAKMLGGTVLPGGTVRRAAHAPDNYRPSPRIEDLPGYAEGMWWVQDLGASLPAKLLGNLTGKRAIDMCAAPGGKSAQMALAGAQVTALDRSRKRLARVAENMKRLRFAVDCEVADATLWQKGKDYDVVLLDAPCTATGTIRRHPDVAWLKDPRDVAKLSATQDALLNTAVRLVRPGGTILYCTCSLQPEEGPDRVAAALSRHPSLARVPIRAEELFGFTELVTPEGDLRSLPSHLAQLGGIDGFYAARLLKQS
ncbi:RsmB/NOP family class I SAM-dependent RNA methyltransferase [Dongia deserti]|uniref:RsmB/NOP family class I SAM-dependent RNA methyltransferase n=1 Tax=Dongia deserti TaxID=2268030 RepID=UPI000E64AF3F|nr:transcription antitermination factor NusB [Dongia deserti]